jgi:hypothetical protein
MLLDFFNSCNYVEIRIFQANNFEINTSMISVAEYMVVLSPIHIPVPGAILLVGIGAGLPG